MSQLLLSVPTHQPHVGLFFCQGLPGAAPVTWAFLVSKDSKGEASQFKDYLMEQF